MNERSGSFVGPDMVAMVVCVCLMKEEECSAAKGLRVYIVRGDGRCGHRSEWR